MDFDNEKQCSRQLQCEVPCSIAAALMSSLLPCLSILPGPPYPPPVMLSSGGTGHRVGGLAVGGGVWPKGGQGTFWSSCHILHYHMVLHPKGTSHNDDHDDSGWWKTDVNPPDDAAWCMSSMQDWEGGFGTWCNVHHGHSFHQMLPHCAVQ